MAGFFTGALLRGDMENKSDPGCDSSLSSFPNVFREGPYNYVYIVCFLILSIYMFWALAIVCDDYLVPSIELLCNKIHMPYDVGGATLLAAATSAPELFVSLIGTFVTKNDLGVSTIVGSSVFNTLAISGVCGIFCKKAMKMDWWPVTRDILWYIIAVIVMTVVIMDDRVTLIESIVFLIVYIINVLFLVFDRRLQKLFRSKTTEDLDDSKNEGEEEPENYTTFKEHICGYPKEESVAKKICWIFAYPFHFIYALTIPALKCCFLGTLLMSVVWVGVLCYIVSWTMTIVGFNLTIPDSVMGVTFLAAGTSVPEAVASYIVTNQGYPTMALSNAIGSNTFDILICLGFPWFVVILTAGVPVIVVTEGMLFITLSLILTAVLLELTFIITRFKMGRWVGWISMTIYVVYVVGSVVMLILNCK